MNDDAMVPVQLKVLAAAAGVIHNHDTLRAPATLHLLRDAYRQVPFEPVEYVYWDESKRIWRPLVKPRIQSLEHAQAMARSNGLRIRQVYSRDVLGDNAWIGQTKK